MLIPKGTLFEDPLRFSSSGSFWIKFCSFLVGVCFFRYFLKFYFMDLMVLIQCLPPGFGGIQEILGLGLDIVFL